MFARTGSQGSGVERIVPVMVLMVVLSWVSTWCVCDDLDQTGAQYSAAEYERANAEVRSVGAAAPHFAPASLLSRFTSRSRRVPRQYPGPPGETNDPTSRLNSTRRCPRAKSKNPSLSPKAEGISSEHDVTLT